MNVHRTLTTLATAAALLTTTSCELQPGQPHHIVVTELEAPWVDVTTPTELWVQMVTEGGFIDRCATNFGGTYHSVIGGQAHVCVVTTP